MKGRELAKNCAASLATVAVFIGCGEAICDSTTMGWDIRPEEAYPQVLQDRLSALGREVEALRALRDDVRADGARIVVLLLPASFQLPASAPPPSPQRIVAAFCEAEGIPFLDLLPALRRAGEAAFIDDVHLSPLGARGCVRRDARSPARSRRARSAACSAAATSLPPQQKEHARRCRR